jgi:hypothetical protein
MGLDWNPGPKSRLGSESEFEALWKNLHAKSCWFRGKKVRRFKEITIQAFETLNVPRVGFESVATDWARNTAFPNRNDQSLTEKAFVDAMTGFYVLDLVPPCDGIPRYTNGHAGGYIERYSFRAQFLKDCASIIGKDLLESSFVSKLPRDTLVFGEKLLNAASAFASERKMDPSKVHLAEDPDSPEFHLDVVFSAGRWCCFWAKKGHWLDAYW